jgi:beta-glucanase (GH16 family)
MKTSILPALILGCLLSLSLNSCKKLQPAADGPSNGTNNGTNNGNNNGNNAASVNPVTTTTVCNNTFNDTTLTNHSWTKVFDDSFTGDLSKWYAYTGGVTNEVMCNEPANAKIVNGELQLVAIKENVTGPATIGSSTQQNFSYTSAAIVSNQQFSASTSTPKVMIVARVQMAAGYGLTSVFSSYGDTWPTNGQINFFQVGGSATKEYATNYFYGSKPMENTVVGGMQYNPVDADLSSCYHVYMTEWSQNTIKYYLDGKLVETKSGANVAQLFNKQQVLSLSLPIGGLYYNNFVPANIQVGAMHVSYIKVFTSK